MVNVGDRAPEIRVGEWMQGKGVKLSDLRGKYVFLHFFQVNCPGCFGSSFPVAEHLANEYGPRGLEVIGLAVRFEEFDVNTKDNLKKLLKEGKLTSHVFEELKNAGAFTIIDESGRYKIKIGHRIGWDEGDDGYVSKTFEEYMAGGTPYEYLIGPDGKILAHGFHLAQDQLFFSFLDAVLKDSKTA
jgi:thiol-disulfide isomerase/thioredoxin